MDLRRNTSTNPSPKIQRCCFHKWSPELSATDRVRKVALKRRHVTSKSVFPTPKAYIIRGKTTIPR